METPDKPAVVMAATGEIVTYAELDHRSAQLARAWRRLGIGVGGHVALISENHPRYLEVYWAATRSGVHLTPINRHLSAAEAAYIVADCGAACVVASAACSELVAAIVDLVTGCEHWLMYDGIVSGFDSYEERIAVESTTPLDDQPRGTLMCYSSGTTGRPKGVLTPLSGRQVDDPSDRGRIGLFADVYGMDPTTRYLSPAPLYHAAPLGYSSAVQALGGTVVVMERFDPVAALRCLEEHRITHSQWVPTMFVRMLKLDAADREGFDFSTHRVAIHAAAPCPVDVKRRMIDWWGPILWEYYAGTEGHGITMIDSREWLNHPGSVGRPVLGRVHVCDDTGAEIAPGAVGLVYFEREAATFEYHHDRDKTLASRHPAHSNWTTIGDIGYVDHEGYLYLTDRQAFLIISGGVNISPQEIEDCLIMHDSVADVAVVGIPDDDMGEVVHATVQPAPGVAPGHRLAEDLRVFATARMAGYKVPRSISFDDDLPRLATGKLMKREVRERFSKEAEARIRDEGRSRRSS